MQQPFPSVTSRVLSADEAELLSIVLGYLRDDIARFSARIGAADSYFELDTLAESLRDRIRAHNGVSDFLENASKSA